LNSYCFIKNIDSFKITFAPPFIPLKPNPASMAFIKEFKEFALKGNVLELSIAVIIGAAFGAIVSSLVEDVITPLLLTPAIKAANVLNLEQLTWGAVKYGKFVSAVIKFFLVAVILFAIIQAVNKLQRKKDSAAEVPIKAPELTVSEKLLMEIRDSLKN